MLASPHSPIFVETKDPTEVVEEVGELVVEGLGEVEEGGTLWRTAASTNHSLSSGKVIK